MDTLWMRTLAGVWPIIRHHHERYDGSGYPDGLLGQPRIPRWSCVTGDLNDVKGQYG